jgi:hypothetical protein
MANNVRNPLGPLIGKAEEVAEIGQNLAASAAEFGGRTVENTLDLGKRATHLALDTAKKPVDLAGDIAEISIGLTTTTVKKLGNFASGLLPALGDRNPPNKNT